MKILWMSRHAPLQAQIDWLNHRFGNVEITQDPNPFDTAQVIVNRYHSGGFDDMVVVAPLSVIDQLIKRGIKPLWAEMDQIPVSEAKDSPYDCVVVNGRRGFRFTHFSRVVELRMIFEEV